MSQATRSQLAASAPLRTEALGMLSALEAEEEATEAALLTTVTTRLGNQKVAGRSAPRVRQAPKLWENSSVDQITERIAKEWRSATSKSKPSVKASTPRPAAPRAMPAAKAKPAAAAQGPAAVACPPVPDPLTTALAPTEVSEPTRQVTLSAKLTKTPLGNALATGALVGAGIGGGMSAISNSWAVHKGTKSLGSATVDAVTDTAVCSATGAMVGGLALATESAMLGAGAVSLAAGAAPVAIALVAVDVAKDAGLLLFGRIDRREFTRSSGLNLAKGGFTWAGMEGGAALGTVLVPGLGTAVGAILGGVAAALIGGWATRDRRAVQSSAALVKLRQ